MKSIVIPVLLIVISCSKNDSQTLTKSHISKMVTTRSYSAKQKFDRLVEDKPAYNMGFDRTIGMDFTWNTKHYDSLGNIVYQEDFNLDDKGGKSTYRKTTQEFYDVKSGKLSKVIEKSTRWGTTIEKWGTIEKTYVRNKEGRLEEILILKNGALDEKTKFIYNRFGQRTRMEVFRQGGLYEYSSYVYDDPSLEKGKIVEEIHEVFGDYNYKEEFQFKRNSDNQILEKKRKYFEKSFQQYVLKSETLTAYGDFINKIPTREVKEGYDSSTVWTDGTVVQSEPYQQVTTFTFNENGNIINYRTDIQKLKKNSGSFVLDPMEYKCEYIYNDKKDWTNIVFSVSGTDKYIVTRDIEYVD